MSPDFYPKNYRSRLGCQIEMVKDLDGITVRIPSATRNLRVDGMQ